MVEVTSDLAGLSLDPFDEAFLADPFAHHRELRDAGPGFGIHQCLGQMVARLEGELLAAEFARQARFIRLAGEPVRRINNTLRAIASLPVEVEPR